MVMEGPDCGEMLIEWAGESWILLPERAVYRPATHTLIITDPHFGKDAAFRSHGIPIPFGSIERDLARLDLAIDRHRPEHLLVLGDFFHAKAALSTGTLSALLSWRQNHAALLVTNIRGNHDRHAGDPPDELEISAVPEPLELVSVQFAHHSSKLSSITHISGHVHPSIAVGRRNAPLGRLPCFWISGRSMVLPAFGGFTGSGKIVPLPQDKIYVIADNEVLVWR